MKLRENVKAKKRERKNNKDFSMLVGVLSRDLKLQF
jgi:hypothetical protein